ncbi:MAG TPA: alpha/beta hydrolase [Elusimicrobiota bacterium]|jgi:pimeloyl-ACP methyl ester carboxylesterase|nr:alpha/beta hydrolase [Elusimicrobiota bacterium]
MEPMLAGATGAVVLGTVTMGLGYYGAGMLIHPPFMSPMTRFPDAFGVAYEKVSFRTSDGLTLAGWFVPSPSGRDETLLICHGWGDNKGEILEQTLFLNRAEGFNLFYFDFRSHGESEGDQVTLGKMELLDFAAAMAFLKASRPRCAENLGVFGLSMGAAVAAMSLPAYPELKAAVLESPFADFCEVGRRWAWDRMRVPYFPLVMTIKYLARWRTGHRDLDSYSPEAYLPSAKTPVFLIAAERDGIMPPSDVRRLYDAARGPKDFWVVPGAVHAKCRRAAPAEYEARVAAFLRARMS